MNTKLRRSLEKSISLLIAACVIFLSPGPAAAQAVNAALAVQTPAGAVVLPVSGVLSRPSLNQDFQLPSAQLTLPTTLEQPQAGPVLKMLLDSGLRRNDESTFGLRSDDGTSDVANHSTHYAMDKGFGVVSAPVEAVQTEPQALFSSKAFSALSGLLSSKGLRNVRSQGWASTLNKVFENSRGVAENDAAVAGVEQGERTSSLVSSDQSRFDAEQASVPAPKTDAVPAAQSSLKRAWNVGVLTAALCLVMELVIIPVVAVALGYQFHSNYGALGKLTLDTVWDGVRAGGAVSFAGPLAEEVLFRGGMLGGLACLGAWVDKKLGGHGSKLLAWLPNIITSVVFVVIHETSDPVLMIVRLVTALAMGAVYQKEGLIASSFMHMVHNALPMVAMLGQMFLGPAIGAQLGLLAIASLAFMAYNAHKELKAQRPDLDAGRVVPFRLTYERTLALAIIALVNVLLFSVTPFTSVLWTLAAAGLAGYARYLQKKEAAAK
ncbi:MAG: CPBP family intramembrane glutamic endopeptidase [Elusimicrobiota bacterium]|jgi:membrane protease YdiL (CAAX protease family)